MHRQSGPALLSAGQWTKKLLFIFKKEADDLCVRCGEAPEHLQHRLWDCKCNATHRAALNAAVPRASGFPGTLPPTTARTGVAPKGWTQLRRTEYAALLDYLWCVSADATTALARDFRDLPPCLPFAYDAAQATRSMRTPFVVSSAPMPLPRRLRGPKPPPIGPSICGWQLHSWRGWFGLRRLGMLCFLPRRLLYFARWPHLSTWASCSRPVCFQIL